MKIALDLQSHSSVHTGKRTSVLVPCISPHRVRLWGPCTGASLEIPTQASQPLFSEVGKCLVPGSFWGLTRTLLGLKGYWRSNAWEGWGLRIDMRVGLPNSCQCSSRCWPRWEEKGKAIGEGPEMEVNYGPPRALRILLRSSRLLSSIFVKVRKSVLLNSLSICFTDFNCLNICYVSFQLYSFKSSQVLGAGLPLKTVIFFF